MIGITAVWIVLTASFLPGAAAQADRAAAPEVPPPVCLPGGPLLFGDASSGPARGFRPEDRGPAAGGGGALPDLWQLMRLPEEDGESFMRPGATMTGMQMGARLLSSDSTCEEEMMPGREAPLPARADCEFDPADDRVPPLSCR